MGKKKKVEISKEPLAPTTVGEVGKHNFGWIFLLFVFVFFIAMIYYLPELYSEFDSTGNLSFDYVVNMVKNTFNKSTPIEPEQPDNENVTMDYNEINNVTNGTIGNISYENITYNTGKVLVTIKNTKSEPIDFSIEPYYIEFYSDSEELISKHIIMGTLSSNASKLVEIKLTEAPVYYMFYQITNEEYPKVDIRQDESGNSVMICADSESTYKYTFTNDKLIKIENFGKYIITDEEYESKHDYFTNLKNNNTKPAITVTLDEGSEEFNYSLNIDYSKGDVNLSNPYYYKKDTASGKIAYMMEADSIICR